MLIINKQIIDHLLYLAIILIVCGSCSKADKMGYITGANKFFLTKEQITALKEKNGDAKAAYKLYEYYEFYEFNEKEAIKWIETSADNGYPLAQYNLSLLYLGEISTPYVPIDNDKAKKLLRQAANGGVVDAKELLEELEGSGTGGNGQ
jgi:TPR repeat protein